MSNLRLISDPHFGHKSMAVMRGFKDEFEHDEYIISQWNKVVHKKDLTIILGDITMETTKWYFRLDELNGRKKVILGNHDELKHVPELLKYVDGVAGLIKYRRGIMLSHCPIHTCEIDRFTKNIHGHVHENTLDDPRYINVSAEVIDYTPKLLTELL